LLPLLHRTFQEKAGEIPQGNVIPVKIHPQRKVGVGCSQLEVDEFVDVVLTLGVEVLLHRGLHGVDFGPKKAICLGVVTGWLDFNVLFLLEPRSLVII